MLALTGRQADDKVLPDPARDPARDPANHPPLPLLGIAPLQNQRLRPQKTDVSREGIGGKAARGGGRSRGRGYAGAVSRSLSEGMMRGLYFIHKYRFLTIAQFGRIAGFSFYHAAEVLRGAGGFSGGLVLLYPGQGKAPKLYYLRRKGFDILCPEARLQGAV
jgi:hypothetical protein